MRKILDTRLAAILSADVVGYSRLIERDEAVTLERFKAHRKTFIEPLIDEHHGRIVKLTGDGALCEFGSVVDAVACAIATQQGMAEREVGMSEDQRIRFRIGINLGDIVYEEDDIYGDGVNVAVRLEQFARPGGILISGTAYDHLQGKLGCGFQDLGEQRVKNIARPVRLYRVLPDDAPGPGARAARPLLGRSWRAGAATLAALRFLGGLARWSWYRGAGAPSHEGDPARTREPSLPTNKAHSPCCRSRAPRAGTRARSGSPTASPRTSSPSSTAIATSS